MKLTRQQRRKNRRRFNKEIKKEGSSLLGRQLFDQDPEKLKEFDQYTASSNSTAVLPFCILFTKKTDLNDYMFACRDGAEAFRNNNNPKIIALIKEKDVEYPVPKQELMKIGTRIFQKRAPNRPYVFIEAEGDPETADVLTAIGNFLDRLGHVDDEDMPPNWLSEYIYKEEKIDEVEIPTD